MERWTPSWQSEHSLKNIASYSLFSARAVLNHWEESLVLSLGPGTSDIVRNVPLFALEHMHPSSGARGGGGAKPHGVPAPVTPSIIPGKRKQRRVAKIALRLPRQNCELQVKEEILPQEKAINTPW